MNESDSNTPAEASAEQPVAPKGTAIGPRAELPWEELGLSPELMDLIRTAGFERPTPIQAASIPTALGGRDLIASAQTGTGKTAAFVIPMVERFAGREGTFGVILSPTREIAQQTAATLEFFGKPRGVRSIVLIGGIHMRLDALAIQSYPQIIVATPGRLVDHLERGNIWLDFIEMVVLDEADRMLDMGFSDQLNRIIRDMPERRQTLLFSATFPPSVEALARRILHEPERVAIGRATATANAVDQRVIWMPEENKGRELRHLLRDEPGSIIIFTRSKDGASRLWRSLHSRGVYDATVIHSDLQQSDREKSLAAFKEGRMRILVATDVAGRGIHVDAVAHVVNYDLPMDPEDYIHRVGRTGRLDSTGKATTFATRRDASMMKRIEKMIGKEIRAEYSSDYRPPGEGVADEPQGGRGGNGRGRRGGGGGRGHSSAGRSSGGGSGSSHGPSHGSGTAHAHGTGGAHGTSHAHAAADAPRAATHAGPENHAGERAHAPRTGNAPGGDAAGGGDPAKRRRRRGRRGGRGRNKGAGGDSAPPAQS
jgi:ATP-dependent RNA helicase RhlE